MAFSNKYSIEDYTIEQQLVDDSHYLSNRVNQISTMYELDITSLRKKLKDYKKLTGKKITLLTAVLYCYAQTLNLHKQALALKSSNNKLYSFEEADIFFPFEVVVNGKKLIERKIIRAANKKTIFELEDELSVLASVKTVTLSKQEQFFMSLPKFIRHFFYRRLMNNPLNRKAVFGNAYFSAALSIALDTTVAFSIPKHFHSSGVFVSGCKFFDVEKNGKTEAHTSFCITVLADHNIINGLDMGRIAVDLLLQINHLSF